MSFISLPTVLAQAGSIPYWYGYCLQPPIVWQSLASAWNSESGTGISGRYHPQLGEVHSVANVKRQDSFIQGTAGRTGIAFDVIAGTWKDDLFSAQYHCYNLTKPSGAYEASESSVVAHSSTSDIQNAEIIIKRGFPPIIASPGTDLTHSKGTNYAYVHLAYSSTDLQDYRIALEYGQPIRLDVSYDGGATWTACAIARDLGNVEKYLAAHNSEIRMNVKISPDFKILSVEIGDGNWLVHSPDNSKIAVAKNITSFNTSDHLLPRNGKIRLAVVNGNISMGVYPVRHDSITLNKSPRDMGRQIPNAQSAFVVGNALSNPDPNQTATSTVNTDGQKFSYQVQTAMPDAGDGLGSIAPAILSDSALVIPAQWVQSFDDLPDGGSGPNIYNLPVTKIIEISNIDDTNRCGFTRGILTLDNHFGQYAGSYANAAISIATSVNGGGQFYQRLCGLTNDREGGIKLSRSDPQRLVDINIIDKSRMMDVGIADEVIFDGWCIFSAVRYLAEQGNIHPSFLSPNIPLYIPPGATVDAPYGPAGYDCPYYSLPRGSGLNPRFKFLPGEIAWSILTLLATISGDVDPVSGRRLPYYTAFDEFGILHFEAVDFVGRPLIQSYSTNDPTGVGAIEELQVFNSIADVRTDVNFQGIDANTFELLNLHIDQPSWVKAAKGFRESWLERNSMYCSQDFLTQTAQLAAYQASFPTQSISMKVPYLPWIFTGMNIAITDGPTLGGTVYCNIKSIRSVIATNQNGYVDSYSLIEARNLLGFN